MLERYFEHQGSPYVFRQNPRRSVISGRNDLVQDAPISRIHLLVCRNTLICFNAETQGKILARLHFALLPDGMPFLGKAEMLLSHDSLFTPIDPKRPGQKWSGSADRPAPSGWTQISPLANERELLGVSTVFHDVSSTWRLRRDEATGQHLLNLDIGLPLADLRPLVRDALVAGDSEAVGELTTAAVNRRGRPVEVRGVASPLRSRHGKTEGAILALEENHS